MEPYLIALLSFAGVALTSAFLGSLLETVFASITPTYVEALESEKNETGSTARQLRWLMDRPEWAHAAALVLRSIGYGVGVAGIGWASYGLWQRSGLVLACTATAIGILFLTETLPRGLGGSHWRRLAAPTAWSLRFFTILFFLPVFFVRVVSAAFVRDADDLAVSREEFSELADRVARQGLFEESETLVLTNLLRFGSLHARDIMTPRTVIVGFDRGVTVQEAVDQETNLRFSRLLVYNEDLDDVTGYVLKHDILLEFAHGNFDVTLGEFERELLVLPALARVADVFEQMLQTKEHLALLVGEYGGTAGIVTLEDVVETLLGLEIVDEMDVVEDMQALARDQWFRRADQLGLVPPSEAEEVEPDEVEDDSDDDDEPDDLDGGDDVDESDESSTTSVPGRTA